jgi:hypothetical protein
MLFTKQMINILEYGYVLPDLNITQWIHVSKYYMVPCKYVVIVFLPIS